MVLCVGFFFFWWIYNMCCSWMVEEEDGVSFGLFIIIVYLFNVWKIYLDKNVMFEKNLLYYKCILNFFLEVNKFKIVLIIYVF